MPNMICSEHAECPIDCEHKQVHDYHGGCDDECGATNVISHCVEVEDE